MKVLRFGPGLARPITQFSSHGAAAVALASGHGESHAYAVHIDAGGCIGPHPAGFDQLFLVVQGSGWVSGSNGVRVALAAGEGAYIQTGETHAKGSDSGMLAMMFQARQWQLSEPE